MPRFHNREAIRRRQRRFKARPTAGVVALRKINKLQSHIEMKHSDTSLGNTEVLDSGLEIRFDNIAQGDTEVTRTGTRITPKGLEVKYRIAFDGNSGDFAHQVRLIFVQSRTVEAQTLPQIENIIDVGTSSLEVLSFYSWELSKQYRILKDIIHTVTDGAAGGQPDQITRHFRIPAKRLQEIRYTPGTSTAETEYGNLGVIVISNEATIGPVLVLAARLLFTDM